MNWLPGTPSFVQVMCGCGSPDALHVSVKSFPTSTSAFPSGTSVILGGAENTTRRKRYVLRNVSSSSYGWTLVRHELLNQFKSELNQTEFKIWLQVEKIFKLSSITVVALKSSHIASIFERWNFYPRQTPSWVTLEMRMKYEWWTFSVSIERIVRFVYICIVRTRSTRYVKSYLWDR